LDFLYLGDTFFKFGWSGFSGNAFVGSFAKSKLPTTASINRTGLQAEKVSSKLDTCGWLREIP
jgi:hypothetical protein